MQAVISFIRANSIKYKNANLTLSTTFPRKVYSGASLSTTLQDAGMLSLSSSVIINRCALFDIAL